MFAKRTAWTLASNRITHTLDELRGQGAEIIDLTESNPTRCGFDYDRESILAAFADSGALSYDPDPRGLRVAREAIAHYYGDSGLSISPDHVFLTTSTSEAYLHVFRLLADPGDAVLVPQPSYPLFDFLGGLNDVTLIPYPLRYHDGWEIDFDALGEAVRLAEGKARTLLVVHPNNPTGSFLAREETEKLSSLCHEQEMALIADEVFRDYPLDGHAGSIPTHAANTGCLTFTLSGLSKICALPQMKLAWLVASGPPDLLASALARMEVITDTYLSVSTPLALALPHWLGTRQVMQTQILARARGNLQFLDEALSSASPISRLKTQGGWNAVLRVPRSRSDEDWALGLLRRHQVLVHPGHFYDFGSDGFLVLSLLPQPEIFRKGIHRLLAEVSP